MAEPSAEDRERADLLLTRLHESPAAVEIIAEEFAAIRAEIEALKGDLSVAEETIRGDNAVCLCGCVEHENYGEDGESCENEDHICIRTCVAIRDLFAEQDRETEKRVRAQIAKKVCHGCLNDWPMILPHWPKQHSKPDGYPFGCRAFELGIRGGLERER